MAKKDYESRTQQLVMPVLQENSYELVDVEWVKEHGDFYLRVYADKEGGITIDDCEIISRYLSDRLDEEDFISENYILEVSSPGLDRPLKKDNDFARSIGKDVEVKLFAPVNGEKEFLGVLKDFNKDKFTVTLEDGSDMEFERKSVAQIRLAIFF